LFLGGFVGFMVWALQVPGQSYSGPLPPLTDQEKVLSRRLERHVRALADEIGPRHAWNGKLADAADYIEGQLRALGYSPTRDQFKVSLSGHRYGDLEDVPVWNIEATLPGESDRVIVIGSHYDTRKRTSYRNSGADDNATGVAVTLELARILAGIEPGTTQSDTAPGRRRLAATIRFCAWVNEEWPWFMTDQMGSWRYARQCRVRGDNIIAMLTPETLGYYSDEPGSQHWPWPFGWFYPDRGNFVLFLGPLGARDMIRECVGEFRRTTRFPSQGGAVPVFVPEVMRSDHWSFWKEDYPAVMITDTADHRYPAFETNENADDLDFDRMARVTAGLRRVVEHLARER
jgi:hypothetical protein